jgi:hypothetical protein
MNKGQDQQSIASISVVSDLLRKWAATTSFQRDTLSPQQGARSSGQYHGQEELCLPIPHHLTDGEMLLGNKRKESPRVTQGAERLDNPASS